MAGEHLCWIVRGVGLRGERQLHHRRNEHSGRAVAWSVSDEHTRPWTDRARSIVDAASDGVHREISCRDIEPMNVRQRSRQQGRLNLACRFHLALHGDELGFLPKQVGHDAVAERNDEDEDANWSQVDVGKISGRPTFSLTTQSSMIIAARPIARDFRVPLRLFRNFHRFARVRSPPLKERAES